MNQKEIGEIRRRQRRERSNMTSFYGCYVNGQKEIITEFCKSTGMMPENEAEKYFAILRRTLTGTIGKNLIDITFRTAQVAESVEHKLLMTLRDSGLRDENARKEIYKRIIDNTDFKENFLILLGCESYDVPFKSDGSEEKDSEDVYRYVLCSVCPVKLAKGVLRYNPEEKEFHDGGTEQVACPPEAGFLFPAFDNRAANIYNALFYTHSPKQDQEKLIRSLFDVQAPKPAEEQKKSFEALLGASLEEDCTLEVVQSVHERLCQDIAIHKESKIPEPLMISKEQVKSVLAECGVPQAGISKFSVEYDETFGFEAELYPKNIIDNKSFQIKTPDVSIKVDPQRTDLIETRVIEGVKYILICANENVEVNGVPIHIADEEPELVKV